MKKKKSNSPQRAMAKLLQHEIERKAVHTRLVACEDAVIHYRCKLATAIAKRLTLSTVEGHTWEQPEVHEAIREHVLLELHAIGVYRGGAYADGFVQDLTKALIAETYMAAAKLDKLPQ